MTRTQAVVDEAELVRVVGRRAFVALPREEHERLIGAVSVHVASSDASSKYLALGTLTVVHRNYVFEALPTRASYDEAHESQEGAPRSLARAFACAPSAGFFLDDSSRAAAHASLAPDYAADEYELRLAGLLLEHLVDPTARWLRPRAGSASSTSRSSVAA